MSIQKLAAVLGSIFLMSGSFALGEDKDKPMVQLGELPKIELMARPAVTDAQVRHVKDLIASLANLDDEHFGLAGDGSGSAFAAVVTRRETEKFLMDDRIINTWPAFKELVALGPDALPHLLDALGQATPTKVVYRHDGDIGEMNYGHELGLNNMDPLEERVPVDRNRKVDLEGIHTYTLKIGDICFLAIGQIVGRSYHPARYQRTGCIVINSPVHDPNICSVIRKAWTSPDPRRRLFDSLRTDYATDANEFQCSAATRLLYYFPKESGALIAARLDHLDVVAKDQAKPGNVHPVEFVKAVAWSSEPVVRAAVARIFVRTDDPDIVLASAPAVDDKAILTLRLLWVATTVPADLSCNNPDNRARWIVKMLIDRIPDQAEPPLREFLKNHPDRTWMLSDALVGSKVDWDIDLLGSLLADKREDGPWYCVDGKSDQQLMRRVCDNVAVTLASNHADLKFQLLGTHDDLDRQIAVMQKSLEAKTK